MNKKKGLLDGLMDEKLIKEALKMVIPINAKLDLKIDKFKIDGVEYWGILFKESK